MIQNCKHIPRLRLCFRLGKIKISLYFFFPVDSLELPSLGRTRTLGGNARLQNKGLNKANLIKLQEPKKKTRGEHER